MARATLTFDNCINQWTGKSKVGICSKWASLHGMNRINCKNGNNSTNFWQSGFLKGFYSVAHKKGQKQLCKKELEREVKILHTFSLLHTWPVTAWSVRYCQIIDFRKLQKLLDPTPPNSDVEKGVGEGVSDTVLRGDKHFIWSALTPSGPSLLFHTHWHCTFNSRDLVCWEQTGQWGPQGIQNNDLKKGMKLQSGVLILSGTSRTGNHFTLERDNWFKVNIKQL